MYIQIPMTSSQTKRNPTDTKQATEVHRRELQSLTNKEAKL